MITLTQQPVLQTRIHDLSHDGRGVGRLTGADSQDQGKTCFVRGALPGELVSWKKSRSRRSYDEGELESLLEPSADRAEPACPHYQQCGGCQLQHLKPAAQLAWKAHQLKRMVERAGLQPETWLAPLASEPWHYRRRTRLAVKYSKGGEPQIGFRIRKSNELAGISECAVLDIRLEALLPQLRALAGRLKNMGLTELELSAADEQLAICCYVQTPFLAQDVDGWCLDSREPQLWFKRPNQQAQPVPGNLTMPLADLSIQLTERTQMSFTPSQFIQINGAMNRAMISQALDLIQPDGRSRVLDLFCGAGNFSLAFAEKAAHVLGVEGSESLCRQARKNAGAMGFDNLGFQSLDLFSPKAFAQIDAGQANTVILDPPRAGAAQLVPWLNQLGVEKLLYISCHAATMVRDLQGLNESYKVQSMGAMDMFPQTTHLEAMTLLVRRET